MGLAVVPAVFAAVQILGVLIGDVVARDDARTPGMAGLEVRRVRDFLPRRLLRLVCSAAIALAVLLTWATSVAGSDDLGRAGRALAYACAEACTTARLTPWPGSYYSVPMTVALLLVVSFAGLAVWITVRRPRNGADPEIVRVDDVVRRRSVESVVTSVGIAISGSLVGLGVITGGRLAASGANHAPLLLQLAGWVALAAGLASWSCSCGAPSFSFSPAPERMPMDTSPGRPHPVAPPMSPACQQVHPGIGNDGRAGHRRQRPDAAL